MNPPDDSNDSFEKEKTTTTKIIQKKIASFEKALSNARSALEKSLAFEDAHHLAELAKANYGLLQRGMKVIKAQDWAEDGKQVCIPIDPKLSPKEVLEDLFKKSRKLKRAIDPLQALINKLSQGQERLKEALVLLEKIDQQEQLDAFKNEYTPQQSTQTTLAEKEKKPPYHRFLSSTGASILVGKNSESNHILTFQVANGSDMWLHAHSVSGAHVVIKKKKEEVDHQTLQEALQLALFHSKAKKQPQVHHEVLVTEQKYVSRTPSMPKGKVLVSKHKIMNCVLDQEAVKKIKRA